jgi:hypothetical protein
VYPRALKAEKSHGVIVADILDKFAGIRNVIGFSRFQ